jgi:hypothetical protein
VFVALDKGIACFPQSTLQKEVEGLAEVWGVLSVDILNALRVDVIVSEASKETHVRPTFSPFKALFPRENMFSFINKSS